MATKLNELEKRVAEVEKQFTEQGRILADLQHGMDQLQNQVFRSPAIPSEWPRSENPPTAETPAALPPAELITSLVHELNQPLTAIATFARACLRLVRAGTAETAELLSALEQIGDEAEHAGRFLHHLRAQLISGRSLRNPVQINAEIQQVVRRLQARIRQENVRLDLQLAEDLPAVLADAIQMEQVLLNLTQNALDAMNHTPAEQRILSIGSTRAGRELIVSVSDTGAGLSAETAQRLFQPMASNKAKGMGLGLSLCRSIIVAHHGRIWAEPRHGRGTTFFLSLPLVLDS